MKVFYRDHAPKYWKPYNNEDLLRGDIVLADCYFSESPQGWKAVDILYQVNEYVWRGNEQTIDVYITKDIVKKIYKDEDYYNRRKFHEQYKYYWEEREI